MSLENAPDEVKLAVDLIMLLENHAIPAETVLKALEIVRRDFEGNSPSPCPLPSGEREIIQAGVGSSPLISRFTSVCSSPFSLRRCTSSWLKAILMLFSRHRRSMVRFSSSTV